ncbi:MAG: DUF3000 domain-containing protein [Jiangellaceae bacterium]
MARSNGPDRTEPENPAAFVQAVAALRAVRLRPEVVVEPTPAPKRLAPYAFALSAEVAGDVATGRLVLLHDPLGQEAWHGEFRLVTYVRASLEPEMAADPLLLGVGWSWLTEALVARGAPFTAASGTVTRVASESFGGMAEEPATAEVEIRASWTPIDPDLAPHALAWGDVLTTAAGLAPLPAGVIAIPSPRGGLGR